MGVCVCSGGGQGSCGTKSLLVDSHVNRASLVPQPVKNTPAMQETWVPSLGWEEGMATHSSILVWRISQTEESGKVHGIAKCQT